MDFIGHWVLPNTRASVVGERREIDNTSMVASFPGLPPHAQRNMQLKMLWGRSANSMLLQNITMISIIFHISEVILQISEAVYFS